MEREYEKVLKRYNHLQSELEAAYHEMAQKMGLSDSAMLILYTICDKGENCPLQEICRCSGLSKQTLNSALRKLEAEGTVYLQAAGGKNKNVCLTEEGKALARRTAGRMMQAENEIFASWSREEVRNYLELTERFLTALREKTKEMT